MGQPKTKKQPCICPTCGHDMGRSRVRWAPMTVRCNKCKTVYDVTITFPEPAEAGALRCTHSQPQPEP